MFQAMLGCRSSRRRRSSSVALVLAAAITVALLPAGPALAAPSNDAFTGAEIVNSSSATLNGSNVGATKEPGEPNHAGDLGGASVWYRWTAPVTGTVAMDTTNSTFDTLLAVYTGGSVSGLSEVASNDDVSPGVSTSKVTFNAVSGTVYHVAVDGFNVAGTPETGNIVLRLNAPPVNDNFAGAQVVSQAFSGQAVTVNGYNIGATREPLEPKHAGNPGGASVWFRWSPPADRTVRIDTFGSDFDTTLAVYTGGNFGSLALVASNDDLVGAGYSSRVRFAAIQGTTYQIGVDGFDGATGNVVFRLEPDRLDTAITSGPSGFVGTTSATFTFAASEPGSTFECSLNGAAFAACTSPQKYTGLAERAHTFEVRAVDAGGNTDDTPASRTWTVDLTSPDTAILSGPAAVDRSTTATFSFTSTQVGSTFQCSLDGAAFSYCLSPTSYAGLAEGGHAFQVRAVDPAGNVDASPASLNWVLDSVAPINPSITSPTTSQVHQGQLSFPVSWSATDASSRVATYDVRYRQAAYNGSFGGPLAWKAATASTSDTFVGSPGNTYCFSMQATDVAGNASASSAERCTAVPLDDTALAKKGAWANKTATGYYLNTYTSSTAKGATLTLTGIQAKHLALVATTCKTCGSVDVLWNGKLVKKLSLVSPTTKKTQFLNVADFGSVQSGTLVVKVTSSALKVMVEGLGVSAG